ncbi:head decoration protein [Burkholderia vietnamiensis]|uniref:head decoration protein n=1 Tax=Burkholderia vietnamiensis TaxID=60552 RepID=UPI001CF3FA6C|nr:head decoration protein [Burkholderia vietnamiensis]MCA8195472.1 head decoration protein [Burkholderia vietnamiensis]
MSYVSRAPLYEAWHPGGFLVSQPRGHRHIDRGTFTGSVKVLPGTVMGKQTVGTTAVAAALGTNTGNGTFGAISVAAAIAGAYTVEFDSATQFVVADPNGKEVGHGTTGAVFSGGGIGFTITAGGTAFAPGDSFTVTVAAGSGKWVPCTKTATDGSQIAAGISFGLVDATLNDTPGALVVRDCEVNTSELVWDASMDAPAQAAALASLLALKVIPR